MKNITISIDDAILEASRKYAKEHNLTLNSLILQLLAQTIAPSPQNWLDECFALMDQSGANSHNQKWNREDLYDV